MRCRLATLLLPFLLIVAVLTAFARSRQQDMSLIVQTPPMGWNSWDAWGENINEAQYRDTVHWFRTELQRYGWQYVIIDAGWYLQHPQAPVGQQGFTLTRNGILIPAPGRYPSSAGGKGFRPLADWVHSQGLRFGFHMMRGIPRESVARNLPIAGSHFRAADAANTSDTCSWNTDTYGVRDNKAGQAWYDSLIRLYASWGIDYLKVDCISYPWHGASIHMIREAIRKSGRPIVLSLSPGPTPISEASDLVQNAQLWRISNDIWDVWSKPAPAPIFPSVIRDQFALLASWEPWAGAGHWPDADMLPIGWLGPTPGWGKPRYTRLTHDEVRTMMTLWSIAHSPLFIGANLLKMDAFTESILTNPEVIDVDQYSGNNHPLLQTADTVIWTATPPQRNGSYIAVFNISDVTRTLSYNWHDLGIPFGRYPIRDLWKRQDLGINDHITVTLAPHASALYKVQYP